MKQIQTKTLSQTAQIQTQTTAQYIKWTNDKTTNAKSHKD